MGPDILLLGANGQVGWELRRSLSTIGRVTTLTRSELDLSDLDRLVRIIREIKPSIIVNAGAYTKVDQAETDDATAFRINADVPEALAGEVRRTGGLLVDYSTDYVFDGTLNRAYAEDDAPNPLGIYGRSKLKGLRAIENSGCRHLVFRVSLVYGSRGANFAKTILRLAAERNELRVVDDQIGAPTPADLIADITAQAIGMIARGQGDGGIYNLAPAGRTSWHGFAKAVVAEAREAGLHSALGDDKIFAITTAEYPTAASRPQNSVLDTSKLRKTFGLHLPDWDEPLARVVREIVGK